MLTERPLLISSSSSSMGPRTWPRPTRSVDARSIAAVDGVVHLRLLSHEENPYSAVDSKKLGIEDLLVFPRRHWHAPGVAEWPNGSS